MSIVLWMSQAERYYYFVLASFCIFNILSENFKDILYKRMFPLSNCKRVPIDWTSLVLKIFVIVQDFSSSTNLVNIVIKLSKNQYLES